MGDVDDERTPLPYSPASLSASLPRRSPDVVALGNVDYSREDFDSDVRESFGEEEDYRSSTISDETDLLGQVRGLSQFCMGVH